MSFEPNTAKQIALALRATAIYDRKRADAMERWADLLDQSQEGTQMNLVLKFIFTEAFPVWERYRGAVPQHELERLERAGDWPQGVAAAAMERLSNDNELRKRLRHFLANRKMP